MRNKNGYTITMVIGIVAVMVTIFTGSVYAQSKDLRVTVPFEFYASGKLMPSGSYFVTSMDKGSSFLRLSDSEGHTVIVSTFPTMKRSGQSRLIFTRYGNQSFLSELHWQGYSTGREIAKSKLELEVRNAAAALRVAVAPAQ